MTADWFARINEGACDYFQLVLNPNSDAAHRDHFHFDLGPWKSCD
ncbi:MAG: extensin family protein [Alphaproteobacteria bacterium]